MTSHEEQRRALMAVLWDAIMDAAEPEVEQPLARWDDLRPETQQVVVAGLSQVVMPMVKVATTEARIKAATS